MIAVKETVQPADWFEKHGDVLLKFARGRLNDDAAARDAVQETYLAAYKSRKNFRGTSSERTWLVGILRHKIIDHIRKQSRTMVVEDTGLVQEQRLDAFDRKGTWRVAPSDWTVNPSKALEQQEFHAVLQSCLDQLDERYRRVFEMRELEGRDIEDISRELGITVNNFSVILHRAKAQLKDLLEANWLQPHAA